MDLEKPFKTIEVIDSRTKQPCKVACMSCIRGHRTTSCGIPVCRPKIFWTVKRPGRPSNSCNCQYGSTGGCRCVVAKMACPHKAKKGEKRSGECRCDEQGRFCCLIEPEQWAELMQFGKPLVVFYPTREALEAKFATGVSTPMSMPMTPMSSGIMSMPGSPGRGSESHVSLSSANGWQSPRSVLAPRFGMMDIGGQQGSGAVPGMLAWQEQRQAPLAPREQQQSQNQQFALQQEPPSCCSSAQPSQSAPQPAHTLFTSPPQQMSFDFAAPLTLPTSSLPNPLPAAPPAFDLDKLKESYLAYQFPSAICQTCGLNGCTCRNCPAVMQNFTNGSWAQCCGRKHARTAAYVCRDEEVQFAAHPEDQATPKRGCCDGAAGTPGKSEELSASNARGGCCGGNAATEPVTTASKREADASPTNGVSLYDTPLNPDRAPSLSSSDLFHHAVPMHGSSHQQHHQVPFTAGHQLNIQSLDFNPLTYDHSLNGLPPEFLFYDNNDPFQSIPGLLETNMPSFDSHDMDLSEFLVQDLDRPPEFQRDSGIGSSVDAVNDEDQAPAKGGGHGGGEGCCCCGRGEG